jgi:hypothetical protein
MLDPAKELIIREAIGDKISAITGYVFVRRPLIDSRADWAELLGVENADGKLEIKYCTVDLLGFADSPTDGCDDDPLTTLSYSVHLFNQYRESAVSDDSNSTDDFTATVLDLRNSFLNANRGVGPRGYPPIENVERLPLVQSGFIILGEDPLTGAFGHYIDLIAKVEVL